MNFVHNQHGKPLWISLTPLIDVVFILLMFFMLSAQFYRTSVMDITVSSAEGWRGGEISGDVVQIAVLANGEWQIEDVVYETLSPSIVKTLLAAGTVRLVADAQTRLQDVVSLLDALSEAGISDALWLSESDAK